MLMLIMKMEDWECFAGGCRAWRYSYIPVLSNQLR